MQDQLRHLHEPLSEKIAYPARSRGKRRGGPWHRGPPLSSLKIGRGVSRLHISARYSPMILTTDLFRSRPNPNSTTCGIRIYPNPKTQTLRTRIYLFSARSGNANLPIWQSRI